MPPAAIAAKDLPVAGCTWCIANADHLPFLQALFCDVQAAQLGPAIDILRPMLHQQHAAQMQSHHQRFPHATDFILLDDAQPVARMWIDDSGANSIHLIDIAVRPERQGQGLGTQMLTALCTAAQTRARPVTLSVAQDNPAQALYARLGFAVQSVAPPYMAMQRAPH